MIGPPTIIEPSDPDGSPLVLCRVEGCLRTTIEGNEAMNVACGLVRLERPAPPGLDADGKIAHFAAEHYRLDPHILCGSAATVDLWIERGLL